MSDFQTFFVIATLFVSYEGHTLDGNGVFKSLGWFTGVPPAHGDSVAGTACSSLNPPAPPARLENLLDQSSQANTNNYFFCSTANVSGVSTTWIPGGSRGVKISFHYFCGGNKDGDCSVKVDFSIFQYSNILIFHYNISNIPR